MWNSTRKQTTSLTLFYFTEDRFWEATSGACTKTLTFSETSQVNCMAISSDKSSLAAGGFSLIHVFDTSGVDDKPNRTFDGHGQLLPFFLIVVTHASFEANNSFSFVVIMLSKVVMLHQWDFRRIWNGSTRAQKMVWFLWPIVIASRCRILRPDLSHVISVFRAVLQARSKFGIFGPTPWWELTNVGHPWIQLL